MPRKRSKELCRSHCSSERPRGFQLPALQATGFQSCGETHSLCYRRSPRRFFLPSPPGESAKGGNRILNQVSQRNDDALC